MRRKIGGASLKKEKWLKRGNAVSSRFLPICFFILFSLATVAALATSKTLWVNAAFDSAAASTSDHRLL